MDKDPTRILVDAIAAALNEGERELALVVAQTAMATALIHVAHELQQIGLSLAKTTSTGENNEQL